MSARSGKLRTDSLTIVSRYTPFATLSPLLLYETLD